MVVKNPYFRNNFELKNRNFDEKLAKIYHGEIL